MSTPSKNINMTPPPPSRPPSMIFTLPQLPTFESTWDFSQFRSQSPDQPVTPSPTRITPPHILSPKQFINTTAVGDYSPKSEKKMCFRAPPPSPRLGPVMELEDRDPKEACTYAFLNHSSDELSAVPGLTDSFTSSASYSSDDHTDSDTAEEDLYHTSTNNAWNSYYKNNAMETEEEQQDEVMEESYILPSAESCYALGFGKLGCPSTPSPVKSTSPIRPVQTPHVQRPSPPRARTSPSPACTSKKFAARPSLQMRRKDSGKSTRSTRTLTQQRYNIRPFEFTLSRSTTVSRPRLHRSHEASLSFTQALESIPPPPPPPTLPAKFDSVRRTRSPPKDYTPPYLSLFPMSSRHSTPNGEVPPLPVPSRRAPRPVTAPCVGSTSTVHLVGAATTILGSAGGVTMISPAVEKSVWEEDSDDEEVMTKKWHIRSLSGDSKGSVKRREKEKWGKRSASDVVKGLFGLHS